MMLPGPNPKSQSSEHHARDTAQNGSPTISFWSCTCGTIIDVSGLSTIYQILLISSRPLESRAQCLENSRVGEGRGPRCRRLAMPSSSKTVMSAATDVDRGMVSPIKSLKLSGNSAEDMPGVLRHMYTLEVTKGWERSEKDRSTSPDSRTWKAFKEGDLDQQRKAEAQRKSAEQLAAEEQKKMAKGRGLVRQATTRLSAAAQQPVTAARRRMSASVQATLSASAADGSGAAKRVQPGTVLWWSYHSREFLEMPASQNKDLPCSPLLMLGYPIWMLLSQLWAKSEANAKAYADRQLLIATDTAVRLYEVVGPRDAPVSIVLRDEASLEEIFVSDIKLYRVLFRNALAFTGTIDTVGIKWRTEGMVRQTTTSEGVRSFKTCVHAPDAPLCLLHPFPPYALTTPALRAAGSLLPPPCLLAGFHRSRPPRAPSRHCSNCSTRPHREWTASTRASEELGPRRRSRPSEPRGDVRSRLADPPLPRRRGEPPARIGIRLTNSGSIHLIILHDSPCRCCASSPPSTDGPFCVTRAGPY